MNKNSNRKNVILGIFFFIGIIFVVKLFFIQVIDDSYKIAADNNAVHRLVQYPHRGLIYDRKGKLLVYNTPVYDLMVVPKKVKIKDSLLFSTLLGLTKQQLKEKLIQARKYSRIKPSLFIPQLSSIDLARINDRLDDFPGFYTTVRTIRSYPHQSLANVLGYIGEVNKNILARDTTKYYKQGDYIGLSGIEATYENQLRGQRGIKYMMINANGVQKGGFKGGKYDTISRAGESLTTTIDLDLQQYGEKLMQNKIGSIVAIEPATGEVLSIVASPSYDPNLLTGRLFSKNYVPLNKDPLKPLFNRPIMALYPPGSIFKVIQALVALQEGVIDSSTAFPCNQSVVKCHPHPSPADLHRSIQYSCNPYYYNVFRKIVYKDGESPQIAQTGLDRWRNYVMKFGLGRKTEIDLANEKSGNVPTVKYYNKVYGQGNWKYSNIYSLSIGQGELGVTPLQMANVAAIVANRGYFYTPHLVKEVGKANKPLPKYQMKHQTDIAPRYYEMIIGGMEDAFRAGTVSYWAHLKNSDIVICGKTGTAQNPHGEDHSVFIAFAPKYNPKIAIAVYVENAGFGGVWAAPIASLMIEKYLTDTIKRPDIEKMIVQKSFLPPPPIPIEIVPKKDTVKTIKNPVL